MYIVIAETHAGGSVHGPFRTAARASGFGFSKFGALVFGNPVKWRVKKVGAP